ncbi:uncharacterized protein [Musca autumnalis]|uniref:uncharacterized protein n=1 Tax=Musca autumnalis TaxID=221902 RepID=UPI003CEADF9C
MINIIMNSNIIKLYDVIDENAVNVCNDDYPLLASTTVGKAADNKKEFETCQCYLKHNYAVWEEHNISSRQQEEEEKDEKTKKEKENAIWLILRQQQQQLNSGADLMIDFSRCLCDKQRQNNCQIHYYHNSSSAILRNTTTATTNSSSKYCSSQQQHSISLTTIPPPTLLEHGKESPHPQQQQQSTLPTLFKPSCTHEDTYAAVPYLILDNSNTCKFISNKEKTTLTVDKYASSTTTNFISSSTTSMHATPADACTKKFPILYNVKHHQSKKRKHHSNTTMMMMNKNSDDHCKHHLISTRDKNLVERCLNYSSDHCNWLLKNNPFQPHNGGGSKLLNLFFILLLTLAQYFGSTQGLLVAKSPPFSLDSSSPVDSVSIDSSDFAMQSPHTNNSSSASSLNNNFALTKTSYDQNDGGLGDNFPSSSKSLSISSAAGSGAYLDKLDNLERSLAAVLIKVAYGTTSTTKRSIPDNSYASSLTTIATPLLTTQRYHEKSRQPQLNVHHRNYELDLERDHALPTTAPNADILKSNSNPTYPNPNRHHNNDRDRHRHLINSTPLPSLPEVLKKSNGHTPTIPMFSGADIPSYSPPARSFFTPPLPPEYQHPFADKPTLRGTNNEGGIVPNTGSYINRRPIPPPSLMPGHERIPFRPPDLAGGSTSGNTNTNMSPAQSPSAGSGSSLSSSVNPHSSSSSSGVHLDAEHKKSSNNATKSINVESPPPDVKSENGNPDAAQGSSSGSMFLDSSDNYRNNYNSKVRKEVLPSIQRILSGSNGRKGDIPEVLLKQVTTRPNYHQPPSSPVVINTYLNQNGDTSVVDATSVDSKQNINKIKNMKDIEGGVDGLGGADGGAAAADTPQQTEITTKSVTGAMFGVPANGSTSTPSAAAIGGMKTNTVIVPTSRTVFASNNSPSSTNKGDDASSTSSSTLAAASGLATSSLAWNIHVYLSVILFTILAVYSLYKMVTYNKLTHLFSQSYFLCIHIILITICSIRTFYLCYDAYNIHSSFHIFVSEILLNLPATFLTISFAVLILFLSLKSLNHKNRYSALIRPLTVVVGCGVHVMLCITLHYVESYTLQNHQQQQKLLMKRHQQQQLQSYVHHNFAQQQQQYAYLESMAFNSPLSAASAAGQTAGGYQHLAAGVAPLPPNPPRVLSLICQIIYIFVCFSLGLLYLYLYRILKRVLRNKSQNYIHGYQNLSYAIHITIATALLFVLLAALQIFGAISISSTRPMISQATAEIDWFQWGYQFSLRLIEIAIITLISWVTGLKTNTGTNTVNINLTNNEARIVGGHIDTNSMYNTNASMNPRRLKQNVHYSQYSHPNVTNFFLPYTSSSSQEQFDMDYPARI